MKVALHTKVRADRIEEYDAAHREVPKELAAAIRAAGGVNGRSGAAERTCSTYWRSRTTRR